MPVLKGYIESTYSRLRIESASKKDKLVDMDGYRYFNTGLLDKFYRRIIVRSKICTATVRIGGIGEHEFEYTCEHNIFSENEPEIAMMFTSDSLPKLAAYFKRSQDTVFNTSLEIKLCDVHIF